MKDIVASELSQYLERESKSIRMQEMMNNLKAEFWADHTAEFLDFLEEALEKDSAAREILEDYRKMAHEYVAKHILDADYSKWRPF